MTALLACVGLGVNCAYSIAALSAAARYDVFLRLGSGIGLAIVIAGSAIECAAIVTAHDAVAQVGIVVAFGGVVVAAACDAACGYVFDAITLPCLALAIVISLVNHTAGQVTGGALAAGGSLFALYAITRGRGLGLGDVKLACCIGAGAGALGGLEALGLAFVFGGAYAALLLITKRAQFGAELRFAPYLAAGMALVIVHGSLS